MIFTREPIIETVITPKDGYKLVIRNSKGGGQEEYFVDAVEVISFGNTSFFRALEKPKSFLVPVNDYEVLEVREARMVLKTSGSTDRSIKIAGGRETALKASKEEAPVVEVETAAVLAEQKVDKRRERRRYRKKRGKSDQEEGETEQQEIASPIEKEERKMERPTIIPPPSTLISESILRRKSVPENKEATSEERVVLAPPPRLIELTSNDAKEDEEIPF